MNTVIRSAKEDNDIKTIVKLADEIWNQHYLPIIGKEQVDYMLGKNQSYK